MEKEKRKDWRKKNSPTTHTSTHALAPLLSKVGRPGTESFPVPSPDRNHPRDFSIKATDDFFLVELIYTFLCIEECKYSGIMRSVQYFVLHCKKMTTMALEERNYLPIFVCLLILFFIFTLFYFLFLILVIKLISQTQLRFSHAML